MLSRRNIRIKIMQLLYAKSRDESLTDEQIIQQYHDRINQSYQLYLFSLAIYSKVAQYSSRDMALRTAKFLPTDEDKAFIPKLSENDLSQSILTSDEFQKELDAQDINLESANDSIKSIYNEFLKTEEYQQYIKKPDCSYEDHKAVLLALYKHCTKNEVFVEMIDDRFSNWTDDKSLVVGAIKKTIKALPAQNGFLNPYKPADETV